MMVINKVTKKGILKSFEIKKDIKRDILKLKTTKKPKSFSLSPFILE